MQLFYSKLVQYERYSTNPGFEMLSDTQKIFSRGGNLWVRSSVCTNVQHNQDVGWPTVTPLPSTTQLVWENDTYQFIYNIMVGNIEVGPKIGFVEVHCHWERGPKNLNLLIAEICILIYWNEVVLQEIFNIKLCSLYTYSV